MNSIFFYRNPETTAPGDGNLQGLKIAIQPNISVAGWPTDAGSNALFNFTALEDATLVERLRRDGASLCGSLRTSEFGFGLAGNKAGAAVKSQEADAELVMDLMGESRLAAALASACGFKPSYGLVTRYGLVGLIPSMECCGILSGSLKNIREILKSIAGPDERDFSLPEEKAPDFSAQDIDSSKISIGVIAEAQSALDAGKKEQFIAAVDQLKQEGFNVREMSFPDFSLFMLVHKIVGSVEASSCAGRYDSVRYGQRVPGARNWNDMYLSSRGAAFGTLLKSYLFQGAFFQFQRYEAYEDACRIRARLQKEMQQITTQADFLVLPAASGASSGTDVNLENTYAQFASTAFANVTGQPVLYLPPAPRITAGLQIAGPRLSDGRLLALGEHLLNINRGGK